MNFGQKNKIQAVQIWFFVCVVTTLQWEILLMLFKLDVSSKKKKKLRAKQQLLYHNPMQIL